MHIQNKDQLELDNNTGTVQLSLDWKYAPSWANWCGVDKSGDMYWYQNKPYYDEGIWSAWVEEDAMVAQVSKTVEVLCMGNKDSLVRRPHEELTQLSMDTNL